MMGLKDEDVLKNFIPAIRVVVAKQLSTKHNFNQIDIASLLGITQAAVSKYLSGSYSYRIKILERTDDVKNVSEKIVGKIVEEKKHQKANHVCEVCKNYSGKCLYRHFALELAEALRETH